MSERAWGTGQLGGEVLEGEVVVIVIEGKSYRMKDRIDP